MTQSQSTNAVFAKDIPIRDQPSGYPEPFFTRMKGRKKRQLGNHFGIEGFGINMTEIPPGGETSVMHKHTKQEEFVFVLEGTPTLETEEGKQLLEPGMCIGYPPNGIGHHLVNKSDRPAVILEIGSRVKGDEGHYPQDDLLAVMKSGNWVFTTKNGKPY